VVLSGKKGLEPADTAGTLECDESVDLADIDSKLADKMEAIILIYKYLL
jgi:hypothetical protein